MSKHGRPDWYNITPMIQVHASEDVNELAARLKTLDAYDRRGNVVNVVDFASGLGEIHQYYNGVGATQYLTYLPTYNGLPTVELAVGESNTAYSDIYGYVTPQQASTYGLEVIFALNPFTNVVFATLSVADGTNIQTAGIKIDADHTKVYYYGPTATWTQVPGTYRLYGGGHLFHHLKFAFDFTNRQYLHMLLNSYAVSMTAYQPYQSVTTSAPYSSWYFSHLGNASRSNSCFLAGIIYTINED